MVGKEHIARIFTQPKRSFFLLGPRGTGKSTWLRETFPDERKIDLLDEQKYQQLLANPGLFAAEMRTAAPGSWVVIDEVQRLPKEPL